MENQRSAKGAPDGLSTGVSFRERKQKREPAGESNERIQEETPSASEEQEECEEESTAFPPFDEESVGF